MKPVANLVTLACGQCQKPVARKPWEIPASGRAFCNWDCANAAQRQWQPTVCFCGREFLPHKLNGKRYCSLSCANRARGMASRKLVDCVCKCGVAFQVKPSRITAGEGKYCSNSCASKFKTREKAAPKTVTCPCGVTFTRPNVRSTQSFCSDVCRLEKLKGGGNLSRPVHIGREVARASVFADLGHSGYVRCPRCSRERERGARCACERQERAS